MGGWEGGNPRKIYDIKGLVDYARPIRSAAIFVGENDEGFAVGVGGITKIVPYEEQGEMSMVPWLAVFDDEDEIVARIPAHMALITYKQEN